MAIQLVTDQLSDELDDKHREQLVGNFKVTEKALNDLDTSQATLSSDQSKINQDLKSIKNDNETRDTNMQELVNILSDYDVPIAVVDGKVIRTEEGD